MLVSLTVGKVDAGLAILLTKDKRLIEFPSVLLPAGVSSGSIVDIQVSRNVTAEDTDRKSFESFQEEIYNLYGKKSPLKPVLRVRNATQTSVVLEWDPIDLATATLRSLALYRNNSKAGNIPNPISHHSTKISGLGVDSEYFFHLVLRTSAGTYASDKITIKTHKMTDLTGITVCAGSMSASERERLEQTIKRTGAKPIQDHVRIDTTHFICTEGRGQGWERAQEMNIPIVRPEWLEACEQEGRIVGVRMYYLGADASMRPARRPYQPPPQSPAVSEHPAEGTEQQERELVAPPTVESVAGKSSGSENGAEDKVDQKAHEPVVKSSQEASPIRQNASEVHNEETKGEKVGTEDEQDFTSVPL